MSGAGPDAVGSARLFIALWPGPELRKALEAWCGSWHWNAQAKRVPAGQLHLTLHFLGDVPRERLPALRHALRLPFAPFSLSLGRTAVWPGQIAVLEPERVPPRLQRLQVALSEVLQSLDLPPNSRGFRPHLTIARRAGSALPPAAGPGLRWLVRGYALVESRPQGQGGYAVLQTYP
jgi:RNA 2',3'-cyclic 3'-phosphodiesterase